MKISTILQETDPFFLPRQSIGPLLSLSKVLPSHPRHLPLMTVKMKKGTKNWENKGTKKTEMRNWEEKRGGGGIQTHKGKLWGKGGWTLSKFIRCSPTMARDEAHPSILRKIPFYSASKRIFIKNSKFHSIFQEILWTQKKKIKLQ